MVKNADCFIHPSALLNSTILDNTPIISIDPGHKNVLSSATCIWKGDQTTYNPQKPKNGSLSLGEYYCKIGNKKYNQSMKMKNKKHGINKILDELSKNSLMTTDKDVMKERLKLYDQHSEVLFKTYGCGNHARKRFERTKTMLSF